MGIVIKPNGRWLAKMQLNFIEQTDEEICIVPKNGQSNVLQGGLI